MDGEHYYHYMERAVIYSSTKRLFQLIFIPKILSILLLYLTEMWLLEKYSLKQVIIRTYFLWNQ